MGHNAASIAPMAARTSPPAPTLRLDAIAHARQVVLHERASPGPGLVDPWIERSWHRCLKIGHDPQRTVAFDPLSAAQVRRTRDANHVLTEAARPVLQALGHALAETHYFAILTNAAGAVVDVDGLIDRSDRRADLITRIGVDLSEQRVGTTAIGAALADPAGVNARLKLLWIACGKEDFLFNANNAFDTLLKEKGLNHEYTVTEGNHSWPVWRNYLVTFVPRLFP
jgi:hypothetical protein